MIRTDSGFSGLEAAIVLVGFVVVAAVFAMSVTTSGFFAAHESEKQVAGGVKQAASSIYIEGGVYASLVNTGGALDQVQFSIGILETGTPQDLSKMKVVYTHSKNTADFREYTYGPVVDGPNKKFGVEGGKIMNPGERRLITLGDVNGPIPGGWFTIEVKPEIGSSTFVKYYLADSFNGGLVLQ